MKDGSLTVIEAAEHLGVSRSVCQRLISDEGLPVERHGRADRIRVDDLDAYLEKVSGST